MRLASVSYSYRLVIGCLGLLALGTSLTGCPEKGGTDKTTAEPERNEHDEPEDDAKDGKTDAKDGKADAKKPAAAPEKADEAKPEDDKEKGGW